MKDVQACRWIVVSDRQVTMNYENSDSVTASTNILSGSSLAIHQNASASVPALLLLARSFSHNIIIISCVPAGTHLPTHCSCIGMWRANDGGAEEEETLNLCHFMFKINSNSDKSIDAASLISSVQLLQVFHLEAMAPPLWSLICCFPTKKSVRLERFTPCTGDLFKKNKSYNKQAPTPSPSPPSSSSSSSCLCKCWSSWLRELAL
ncbi:hypothetical protein INR49_000872 [Caranx melampygus]|nr:hypothetical protein INR49_000872 [Caranx melampygus]